MPTRLVLLCAGATAAVREGRFGTERDALDAGGRAKVCAFALPGPPPARCVVSPAAAARETATLLGVEAEVDAALRDRDHGAWAGKSLSAIDPVALSGWLAAPEAAVAGGESMDAVGDRVAAWLDALGEGRLLAITHAAVLRAAVARVMGVPAAATAAIDIAPLTMLVLSRHDRWRIKELRSGGAADTYP